MEFAIRRATRDDLDQIIELLADDVHGATRERPGNPVYAEAFEEIDNDPNRLTAVVEQHNELVGTLSLTFSRTLEYQGRRRMNIESVRVHRNHRKAGIGTEMIKWAIDEAKRRGVDVVRLTSHNDRVDAHRFYKRLGFTQSHVAMVLELA
ncbi:N-acetyltransferase [Lentzea sp. NBRC 105346]|uniref:GNAT family N-acetyltransferase n=1 Tax=Lentzea sp. NBRC 105346 TaxID=3032205 RepID=UPI0024A56915|nr:GNAT family N-acetyltransferase [Lentzea sp. NBRC 105346]GLZ32728.1 N-acetyltransferase [Lentzea sp. NBRC 105346]